VTEFEAPRPQYVSAGRAELGVAEHKDELEGIHDLDFGTAPVKRKSDRP